MLQVKFAVFGKESREGRFLREGTTSIIFGLEFVDLFQLSVTRGDNRSAIRTFHLSISSVSQGFSFLCVDGILKSISAQETRGAAIDFNAPLGTVDCENHLRWSRMRNRLCGCSRPIMPGSLGLPRLEQLLQYHPDAMIREPSRDLRKRSTPEEVTVILKRS